MKRKIDPDADWRAEDVYEDQLRLEERELLEAMEGRSLDDDDDGAPAENTNK